MQRIALGIEYDGANYSGWQKQLHSPSIQANLQHAISKVACHEIEAFCAGRTDAGVHASGQVIHFNTSSQREEIAWIRGVNSYLPPDIRVNWCKPISDQFDARKSALHRRYCYLISNRSVSPGIFSRGITWIYPALDISLMQEGANYLLGTHDFSSFRGSHCQAKTPIRTIQRLIISRLGENIIIDVTANAFLHHMVRNIVGTLIQVGHRKCSPGWVKTVLSAKDRRAAGTTASPCGLYLVEVSYPEHFQIPGISCFPWFFNISQNNVYLEESDVC